jgi:hypothetical protein
VCNEVEYTSDNSIGMIHSTTVYCETLDTLVQIDVITRKDIWNVDLIPYIDIDWNVQNSKVMLSSTIEMIRVGSKSIAFPVNVFDFQVKRLLSSVSDVLEGLGVSRIPRDRTSFEYHTLNEVLSLEYEQYTERITSESKMDFTCPEFSPLNPDNQGFLCFIRLSSGCIIGFISGYIGVMDIRIDWLTVSPRYRDVGLSKFILHHCLRILNVMERNIRVYTLNNIHGRKLAGTYIRTFVKNHFKCLIHNRSFNTVHRQFNLHNLRGEYSFIRLE